MVKKVRDELKSRTGFDLEARTNPDPAVAMDTGFDIVP
jgi:hypothetical protein